MATKTKKTTKYHYYLNYRRGDYFEISDDLSDKYGNIVWGSGCGVNGFDIHLFCTPKQYKSIVAYARRNYGKIYKITRYTAQQLYGDEE